MRWQLDLIDVALAEADQLIRDPLRSGEAIALARKRRAKPAPGLPEPDLREAWLECQYHLDQALYEILGTLPLSTSRLRGMPASLDSMLLATALLRQRLDSPAMTADALASIEAALEALPASLHTPAPQPQPKPLCSQCESFPAVSGRRWCYRCLGKSQRVKRARKAKEAERKRGQ